MWNKWTWFGYDVTINPELHSYHLAEHEARLRRIEEKLGLPTVEEIQEAEESALNPREPEVQVEGVTE